tara:strand:- start:65 stop:1033 length:969 start_codon:yes stop_codon:yes gene_type:complete
MAFYFGYDKILYYLDKKYVMEILQMQHLIDTIAENNDFLILIKLCTLCNLISYCTDTVNKVASNQALYSAIKHHNIEMVKMLHEQLNTIYISNNERRISLHNTGSSLLIFSGGIGDLPIIKYVCYHLQPFYKTERSCYKNTIENRTTFELTLEEMIKYDHIECAFFFLDYYKIIMNIIHRIHTSSTTLERIRTKAQNIHYFLFNNTHRDRRSWIDWWSLKYNGKKLQMTDVISYIDGIDIIDGLSERLKGQMIVQYLSKLLRKIDARTIIYISINLNDGYFVSKRKIINNMLMDLYYKPLTHRKKNINLYIDYKHVYDRLTT